VTFDELNPSPLDVATPAPVDITVSLLRCDAGTGPGMRVDQQHDGDSRGRARLRDVARLAGVSTMTVNRVLQQPHKVAPATRTRVENVLRET
ncbi:MAG: LacI family DNA-binding transcriptional regulator, partial [Casimicrobiaceae bacterium]